MLYSSTASAGVRRGPDSNVRFVGALTGCYSISNRRSTADEALQVYACRLCSISPQQAVIIAPILASASETVVAHFKDFGILRTKVARELPTGFVVDIKLDEQERTKLAAKIRWKKQNANSQVPDKREFPRLLPRHPRSVLTLADGTRMPCFVIDISQSGAAISAAILPGKGTPLALGSMVGRVVRRLEVGFAIEFIQHYPLDELEQRLTASAG